MSERKMGIRIVLVVEDQMLSRFCREVLLQLGYHRREIRVEQSPAARGSGKQWVDRQFVLEVKALRRKRNQSLAVLVGSDVDEMTLGWRLHKLHTALDQAGLGERTVHERIAYWLPKWSIETWLKRLDHEQVDEETRYKHQLKDPAYQRLAAAFVDHYRAQEHFDLPTLEFAYRETPRIEG